MFQKSRNKIIAFVMGILLFLIIGTLSVIYFTTYTEVNHQNREMLEMFSDLYKINGMPKENLVPKERANRRFQVSTFYSVVFSPDGEVLEIDNDIAPQMTDEELANFAKQLIRGHKTYGTKQNVVYLITAEEEYTLVTMMDNTVLGESMDMLLRNTIIFCCICIPAVLVLSVFLSKWIIYPLEESYRNQKQFISDAGHELKTPISTIHANTELLNREIGDNPWLSNIRYENQRMSDLVHKLLDLARLETVSAPLERLDFSQVVMASILPFEGNAFEQGIQLDYEIPEAVYINGNKGQLGELVAVLLDNALQHALPHSSIQIILSEAHGSAFLKVSNAGAEIPVEEREKIFERFYRMDKNRTGEGKNYGLGLAIAKAIVTAHHGKICVSCTEERVTFTVLLPLFSHEK